MRGEFIARRWVLHDTVATGKRREGLGTHHGVHSMGAEEREALAAERGQRLADVMTTRVLNRYGAQGALDETCYVAAWVAVGHELQATLPSGLTFVEARKTIVGDSMQRLGTCQGMGGTVADMTTIGLHDS